MPRVAWIVLSVALAAVVVALTGAAFLIGTGSETSVVTETTSTVTAGAPPRLRLPLARDPKALMLAGEAEPVLVGLAARPGGPVEVGVLDGEQELDRARLSFRVGEAEIDATPCGFGCSRLRVPVLDGKAPQAVSVLVDGEQPVRFRLPARLPPSGSSLFRRAERSMRSLRSYGYRERLSSGVGAITTQFQARAPNRLQLRTSTGSQTVIIGGVRWDKVGARWERSSFPGLSTRAFMWDGAVNARVVGTAAGGARVLTAFDSQPVPAWFRLTVGPDGRVREAEMIAPSHFMTQGFSRFNAPIRILPPR